MSEQQELIRTYWGNKKTHEQIMRRQINWIVGLLSAILVAVVGSTLAILSALPH
ncbi:hypothetical protein [Leifsonia poae]|uniref:hypothetical protein n=1 Tax=Leifsonia poae TaxID=110933 RepID=UPI001CBF9DB9|nr:hypothetical protein [Leifsonia poae]